MKIIQLSLLCVALIGSLHGAAKKGTEGKFAIPELCDKSKIKVHNPGDIVASGEQYKRPHVIVDGMPYPLTAENLKAFFEPCSLLGNYAPVIDFFYNELPKYLPCDRQPALNWLKSVNNDPVFIYLYLRYCSENFTQREYANLSYAEVIDFWVKRYVAEILFKMDQVALNLNKENAGHYVALQHVDTIIERYIAKLDFFMKGFAQATFGREAVLKAVVAELMQYFVEVNEKPATIHWHGRSTWLLTTKIASNSLGVISFGYLGGTHFVYGSLEENKAYVDGLGLTKKKHPQLYLACQEIARNVLMPLLKEVNSSN